jgi:uncharacterized protein (TIGR02145 family)
MMRFFCALILIFTQANFAISQAPLLIPYQGVVFDSVGGILASEPIQIRFSIRSRSLTGDIIWQEVQSDSTSDLGLINVNLGELVSLENVDWSASSKFLHVEVNFGNGYFDFGTQPLVSVPYAFHGSNGFHDISDSGDSLILSNGNSIIIPGLSDANSSSPGMTTGTTLHSCGTSNVHNPELIYGSTTDQEGNVYKTIVIGTQEWMAENLNTSIYRNGDAIVNSADSVAWRDSTSGLWTYYNNDASYACPYGKLYNGFACLDERGLCPVGWHIPVNDEWDSLLLYLDPNADLVGYRNVAGVKMKSIGNIEDGTGLWMASSNVGTNSSGFSGIGGGFVINGLIGGRTIDTGWWIAPLINQYPYPEDYPYYLFLQHLDFMDVSSNKGSDIINNGWSVRCLRD